MVARLAEPTAPEPSEAEEIEAVEQIEEDSAPVGPSEAEESAYLAGEAPASVVAVPDLTVEDEPEGELPPLAELVKRIPADTLKIMDETFRAKFIAVRRVPAGALKKK